jgi:hypothetical protein
MVVTRVRVDRGCVRKSTNVAINCNIARWRFGGQKRNWGCTNQVSGIHCESVRSMRAIRKRTHSYWRGPSPHTVRRWGRESTTPQCGQRSSGARWIACRRIRVGRISCSTLNHAAVVHWSTGVCHRFIQIWVQWAVLLIRSTRIVRPDGASCSRVTMVLYTRRRNPRVVSVGLRGQYKPSQWLPSADTGIW